MSNPLVDSRDVRFVLYEMLEADKLSVYPKFSDLDKDIFEDVLNLAEKIAVEYFYPSNFQGDKEGGAEFLPETNQVRLPEIIKKAWRAYIDTGFLMSKIDKDEGGMGLPNMVATACDEYFLAGNTTVYMYALLTLGAASLIKIFGTDEQKRLFERKMLTGEYCGTMCLTEPDAGSDTGNIKTKAVKQKDGSYLITGQKIFISAGEHDLSENIIHAVLARIEGHSHGTKGLSVFIVPKYLVNSDGSIGERNDVVCSGIEHKMGIKSSSTAVLNFGDNGKCIGYLLGQEKKGMRIMFHLMAQARIETGLQALGQSSTAYLHAVTYAKNRIQGARITDLMNPDAHKVPIIEHPDVRRMLLWMKSYIEGMRMLAYFNSKCVDLSHVESGEEAKKADAMVQILTPVVKAGISDASWLVTAEAMQVYGGYGYITDYKVEQYARDTKIFSIYEGTNGIQALDLIFRKILMNEKQYDYKIWKGKVRDTINTSKGSVDDKYITPVSDGLKKTDEAVNLLADYMNNRKILLVAMNATPFLKAMFMLNLAWMHLWSLSITIPKLHSFIGDAKGDSILKIINTNNEAAFYSGKVLSSQYYIGAEFHKFFGIIEGILSDENAVLKTSSAVFTGAMDELK